MDMRPSEMPPQELTRTETADGARGTDADGVPVCPEAAMARLVDTALRKATRTDMAFPRHLLLHLSKRVEAEAVGVRPDLSDGQRIGRSLAAALVARLAATPKWERASAVVSWLLPVWRLERFVGLEIFPFFDEFFSAEESATVRELVAGALLEMLPEVDSAGAAPDAADPLFVRELVALSAIPLELGGELEGATATLSALLHGVYRFVRWALAVDGPAVVARWVRLCRSRSALRYVAGLDVLRRDAALTATLLLHGGPREIAVAIAALRGTPRERPLRSELAALTRREASLSLNRARYLYDELVRFGGRERELLAALEARRFGPLADRHRAPVADALLPQESAGLLEAVALASPRCAGARQEELLAELLAELGRLLAPERRSEHWPVDGDWAATVAGAVALRWEIGDATAQHGIQRTVVMALGEIERRLNRGRVGLTADPEGRARARDMGERTLALAALAIHLARALPVGEGEDSFVSALRELALRLWLAKDGASPLEESPLFEGLRRLHVAAPDPTDVEQVDALADYLARWQAADTGGGLRLPEPNVAPVLNAPVLGLATLT